MYLAARPPLRRILGIDRAIRAGQFPNSRLLAEQLEAGYRTVQRDLEFMRNSLGAPLEFCRRRNGYYYTNNAWRLPYFQLTEGELVALFIAEQALRQYRGTPYEADLAQAFRKLAAWLPDEITIDLSVVQQTHSFRSTATTLADVETFRRLAAAVLGRQQLRLTYWAASRDAVTERVVDPWHLTNIDGDWYLIAYCHLREDVRMFAPGRIRQLEETGVEFDPPADFSIARYLDGVFRVVRESGQADYCVRLRFGPDSARYVREKVWHASQTLVEQADGGVELTMQVSSLIEVRRWALSFGADCQVLDPPELREQLREDIAAMAALYAVGEDGQQPKMAPSRTHRTATTQKKKGAG